MSERLVTTRRHQVNSAALPLVAETFAAQHGHKNDLWV